MRCFIGLCLLASLVLAQEPEVIIAPVVNPTLVDDPSIVRIESPRVKKSQPIAEPMVIDAFVFTGEIPSLKNKITLTGDVTKIYDLEKDIKFSLRSTLPPQSVSLVVSVNRKDTTAEVYTFVPYLVQPEVIDNTTIYNYFYGLGKFSEGDRVSLAVTQTDNSNMIVYRTSFYAPIRRWVNFESGLVRFANTNDLRAVVGIRVFFVPRDTELDLTYENFRGFVQHLSIYAGATITDSVFVASDTGNEQAYLLGGCWEINRYFSFVAGGVFYVNTELQTQPYFGVSLNNDLFTELMGSIFK